MTFDQWLQGFEYVNLDDQLKECWDAAQDALFHKLEELDIVDKTTKEIIKSRLSEIV